MSSATLVYDIDNNRYLNITGRCTLVCRFCPKQQNSRSLHQYQLDLNFQPKATDIIPLLGNISRYQEFVFCGYGEPTLNLITLLEVARYIKQQGGKVRVNTDGLGNLFHRRNILPELQPWVDSLSISLNAHTEDLYNYHCQPKLKNAWQAVNEFIKLAPNYINEVKVSAIDGLDGVKLDLCEQIVNQAGCQFKYRKLGLLG